MLVARLEMRTVTAGTAAPLESVTVPSKVAVVCWAMHGTTVRHALRKQTRTDFFDDIATPELVSDEPWARPQRKSEPHELQKSLMSNYPTQTIQGTIGIS